MAKVTMTPTAAAQLESLPRSIQARMLGLSERLRKWPEVSGAKPLTGNLAGRFRLRTGDYRPRFDVAGEVVTVDKIGHRDRFYKD